MRSAARSRRALADFEIGTVFAGNGAAAFFFSTSFCCCSDCFSVLLFFFIVAAPAFSAIACHSCASFSSTMFKSSSSSEPSPKPSPSSSRCISSKIALAASAVSIFFFSCARFINGNAKTPFDNPSGISSSPPLAWYKASNAFCFARLRLCSGSSSSESDSLSELLFVPSSSEVSSPGAYTFCFNCCANRCCSAMASLVPGKCAMPFFIALFAHLDVLRCFNNTRSRTRKYSRRSSAVRPSLSNPFSSRSSSSIVKPRSSSSPPSPISSPFFFALSLFALFSRR